MTHVASRSCATSSSWSPIFGFAALAFGGFLRFFFGGGFGASPSPPSPASSPPSSSFRLRSFSSRSASAASASSRAFASAASFAASASASRAASSAFSSLIALALAPGGSASPPPSPRFGGGGFAGGASIHTLVPARSLARRVRPGTLGRFHANTSRKSILRHAASASGVSPSVA